MTAMSSVDTSDISTLEALRLKLHRTNDADGFERIVAPDMIYVHETGRLYEGQEYIAALRSHGLRYNADITFDEDIHREIGDTFIAMGLMGGHARLEGEAQVFHIRYLAIWVRIDGDWKLQLCQKTPIAARAEGMPNRWR
ncbi:MAG: nuclear transport factor 2 family protein [Caulobacteraceae bacterium]